MKTATSQAQTAVFRIDHRLVECMFYRVSSVTGAGRILLMPVRDAGANPDVNYDKMLGAAIRERWNITSSRRCRGFTYLAPEVFARIVVS